MAGSNKHASDSMIRRLETELRETQSFTNGIIERADSVPRDLNEQEKETLVECRTKMGNIKDQIIQLEDLVRIGGEIEDSRRMYDNAVTQHRIGQTAPVEYRSAGAYVVDMWRSHLGEREATERLDMFYREAEHQKTSDSLGVVPDPIVGGVINFIDSARPVVSALGPRPLPAATWHRPIVTQHTATALQGVSGLNTYEKTELTSQKMIIDRITASAKTFGGYVNVSRQAIDFTQPSVMDIVVNDLAAQYAIDTEAEVGDALAASATAAVGYGVTPDADSVAAALWEAAAAAYTAVRGQGRLVLAVAPDVLQVFGPLFQPVNPISAQSPGFTAGSFGQGTMGTISGIPCLMSSGIGTGEAYLFSTAALEVYEQRIGTLQVTEPSVLGVQVAYAGYFTSITLTDDAIIPLTATT